MRNLQEASVKSSFFQKGLLLMVVCFILFCSLATNVTMLQIIIDSLLSCLQRGLIVLRLPFSNSENTQGYFKKKKKVNSGWGVVLSGECWPSMFRVLGFIPSSAKQTNTKPCSPALIVSYVSHLASECPVETFKPQALQIWSFIYFSYLCLLFSSSS